MTEKHPTVREIVPGHVVKVTYWNGKQWWTTWEAHPDAENEGDGREPDGSGWTVAVSSRQTGERTWTLRGKSSGLNATERQSPWSD